MTTQPAGLGWLVTILTTLAVGIIVAFFGTALVLATSDRHRFDPLPRTVTWEMDR